MTRWATLRDQVTTRLVQGGFESLSRIGSLHPMARPERHGVERINDVPYLDSGDTSHLLDIYRPTAPSTELRPTVLYVHGGGFRLLSKETHWGMSLAFARRGLVVFTINYRLAPRHRYPAGLSDCCAALAWVRANAARYGADPDRILLAGESAGANLVTAMAIAASWQRDEPWTQPVHDAHHALKGVLPACGIFAVGDRQPYTRNAFIGSRIAQIGRNYLPPDSTPAERQLADVAGHLETVDDAPANPLPPFFIVAGGKDPIRDDSHRLHAALQRHGASADVRVYADGGHAFHAFLWTRLAQRAWRDQHGFVDQVLGGSSG